MGAWTVARRLLPALHPVLFASYPLLSLFEHNESDVELGVLWGPLVVVVAVSLALYGFFLFVVRRSVKAGALASLVLVAFFYFGIFDSVLSIGRWWFFALWLVLSAAGAALIVRTRSDLANVTLIVSAGAAVLVIGPVVKIALYQAHHRPIAVSDPRLWPTRLPPLPAAGSAPRRDIYVIVADDYARIDVLRQYFHYTDTSFVWALRSRGFVISPQSRSPYSDSEMNIAAAVNMDYLSRLPGILGTDSQDVRPVRRLIADNRAARLLKAVGYRYVHVDTDEVTYPVGNPRISPLAAPDSFPNLWLRNTVLRLFGGRLGFDEAATGLRFRHAIHAMFARLAEVARQPGPKFVLFHTLLPHDPYIFGAHGERISFPNSSDQALGSKRGTRAYVAQLRYLNGKLLEAVDAILARVKPKPVVIIQSDEGFQANSDTFGEEVMRQIRVKGLVALYLPGLRDPQPPRPPNTVNTLRYVLDRYFHARYPLLRSASYPELDLPYQFEEMRIR